MTYRLKIFNFLKHTDITLFMKTHINMICNYIGGANKVPLNYIKDSISSTSKTTRCSFYTVT